MGKINYLYKNGLNSKEYYPKERKSSKFRTLYGFEDEINSLKKETINQFDCVIIESIILDIDNADDVECALSDSDKIIKYLFDKYNAKANIYYTGKKGVHIEIPLKEPLKLRLIKNPKDNTKKEYIKIVNAYSLLRDELINALDITSDVDNALNQANRLISLPNKRKNNERGRTYKISIGNCRDLDKIIEYGKANKDIETPKNYSNIEFIKHLQKLDKKDVQITINKSKKKPVKKDAENISVDDSIYGTVFNELNTNKHNRIFLIGSGLNGYIDDSELDTIYNELTKTTDIEDSDNAKGSFYDAYYGDNEPCNLGALRNHYTDNNMDLQNFEKLSYLLNSKIQLKSYNEFNAKLDYYNNDWFEMLDNELFDYVDNTENIFKGIINGLSALFGYGSRFIVVNGGAEVGKSQYVNTIKQLMPRFENLGSSTPASIRRREKYSFDKNIVYLGDKGLKGKDDEEFKGLQEVFGGLITDKEFIRDIIVGDKLMKFNLISDGLCVFYTEPYTNLRKFGAGDQYTTRSSFIIVNPVNDGLSLFLQDEDKINTFYPMHRNYINHIISNPIDINITNPIKIELYNASKGSLRTAKYLLALFKAYCQYLQLKEPSIKDVKAFLEVFKPQSDITEIEYLVYKKLYKNLKCITIDGDNDIDYLINDDGSPLTDSMLLQVNDRKNKSFFTAKQIKTYFKNDFKMNKNLKDTIDQIPDILNNLYNGSYLERLDYQYNGQNVYYIPYNKDMDK